MPDTYSGPVRLTDTAGEHSVAGTLEVVDDSEWLGILFAPLDWPALGAGRPRRCVTRLSVRAVAHPE